MIEFVIGDKVRYLPCMHTYHTDCIDDWLMRSFTCPSCMEPVDAALLVTYETNWKARAVSRNLITISKKMKESISSVMWILSQQMPCHLPEFETAKEKMALSVLIQSH